MTMTTLHPTRRSTVLPTRPTQRHRRTADSRAAVTVTDHPTSAPAEPADHLWVDLCGLDYYARRRSLFATLGSLEPGEEVQLVSDRADDMSWLRYEWEARIPQRYCWSLPQENNGTAQITVRLPEQRQ